MKRWFKNHNIFIILILVSLTTFAIIRTSIGLKPLHRIVVINEKLEMRYPWLVITENNNSHWKVTLEDTLQKREYVLIDTTVKSGELVWHWNYNKKMLYDSYSIVFRFYLNGEKLEKLNIRGGGCTQQTQYLDPPYE